MDRSESTNEGDDSSPETVIARSSSEGEREEKPPRVVNASGEYITVDSCSSLDTLASGGVASTSASTSDRKTGKFGAFKSGFRRSGIFKIKRRPSRANENGTLSIEADPEQGGKETPRRQSRSRQPEEEKERGDDAVSAASLRKKKKKKSHSLVRKLSLSKFRPSTEQEARRTPEGGDSSGRSRSQSSQESPVHTHGPIETGKKGQGDDVLEREEAGELKRSEKLLEKSVKADDVVQRSSPPPTIKSLATIQQQDIERRIRREERDTASSHSSAQCSSTLPYALSRWINETAAETTRGKASNAWHGPSDPSIMTSRSPPVEVRRKLSLLQEKRALFQRRFFDSSEDARANDASDSLLARPKVEKRDGARHANVKTFDTFSTLGNNNSFDEDTTSTAGYLAGIDEDCTEDDYSDLHATMATRAADCPVKTSSLSNNPSNLGVIEKRELLYKILVIGELGAGKTSIIKRYVHQFFSQHYRATIGVDFALKVLNWDPDTIIRLQLWDIAGQERFGNMTRVYYKEAVGAFIVFDVTRSATLDAVVKWKQDLDSKVQLSDGSPIPCVLLANKCDQNKEGLVNSPTKMDEYCKEKSFSGWFETSAKENINIEEAARFLVNKILQNDHILKGNGFQDQLDSERFALNQSPASSKKSCAC